MVITQILLAMTVLVFPPSQPASRPAAVVRFATFNIQRLSARKLAEVDDQGRGTNTQLRKAAEIIQRVRPDVLLINEIDYDAATRRNAARFLDRYLKAPQNGQRPLDYPYIFFAPVNTGVPTGKDLDHDGKTDGPADAYGFGRYPGQYGMALYSRFPIDPRRARTFQKLPWKDMPGNLMPDGTAGKPAWYSADEAGMLRLSSKSHWDVPVDIGGVTVHVLASHPTPPVFDGPEDRNGRRNYDEIRFWADYIAGGTRAAYIRDDRGAIGGLKPDALFVIMGDLNADPVKADAPYGRPAIAQLLDNPRVRDPRPHSAGAAACAGRYPGDQAARTSHFGRLDYVLPCRRLVTRAAGVFWPPSGDPRSALVREPAPASDHRLVWVDVVLPGHSNTQSKTPRAGRRASGAP